MGALRRDAKLSENGERPAFYKHRRITGEALLLLKMHIVVPVPFLV